MLKFNQLPPTAETTEVDAREIRLLAYGIEDGCINSIAEVCAAIVLANTTDLSEIEAIGQKIGMEIAGSEHSKYPEDDGEGFTYRYNNFVKATLKPLVSA